MLDFDGDGKLTEADKVFLLGGWEGSTPIVGDWNGNGRDSAGVHAQGHFALDFNADHAFEPDGDDEVFAFGWTDPSAQPLVGDWNGNGRTKVGVFFDGEWLLDLDGNRSQNGLAEVPFTFGPDDSQPIVGDWAGIGQHSPGAVKDGAWYLDINADLVHDEQDVIRNWGDVGEGQIVVAGSWGAQ